MIDRFKVAAGIAALALALGGCGGDDDAPAGSGVEKGANDSASAGVEKASKLVAELTKRPTSISVTEPVGKPIPEGKNITWISCGVPVCVTLAEEFKKGAQELGWNVKIANTDATPASVQAAWKQAVLDKPDAIASSGTDTAVVSQQLKALEKADIPVVLYSVVEKAPGVTLLFGDADGIGKAFGEPQAAWIAADSRGKANTLYVTLPAFPILKGELKWFQKTYEETCTECEWEKLDIPVTAFGKDVPQRIVSKLRANPEINYLAMAVDDLTIGLPAALRAAGLSDRVRIIGASSTPTNFQYIASGDQAAGVPNAVPELTWQMVDGLARIFTGQSTAPDEAPSPRLIVTKDNLPSTDAIFPFVEDYQAQYRKLWGK